jgi:YVTN family beta-propeller protein
LGSFLLVASATGAQLAGQNCGPFADVPVSDPFCPSILQVYSLGLTAGVSPTTFGPTAPITRQVLAAFLTRASRTTTIQASRRAALDQFWIYGNPFLLGLTGVGGVPTFCKSDGADLWVTNNDNGTVARVRASDGKYLESWTGATGATGVLSAMGRIVVAGGSSPGNLYLIEPSQSAGAVVPVATVGANPVGIAYDGVRVWTANYGGSVSIVTPGATLPWTTVPAAGSFNQPWGLVFDGANMWVTDRGAGTLLKLDWDGAVVQTVPVGSGPQSPAFDGANIWVPNGDDDSVTVVQASTGAVIATLTGSVLTSPAAAAFDGQRVLVTNYIGNSVSLWTAADLKPYGAFGLGDGSLPLGVCSDGINFWIALAGKERLARF